MFVNNLTEGLSLINATVKQCEVEVRDFGTSIEDHDLQVGHRLTQVRVVKVFTKPSSQFNAFRN